MIELVADFKKYLIEKKGVSPNTLESYMRDVSHYISYWDSSDFDAVIYASTEDIEKFIKYLRDENKSAATITRTLASVRGFYQFLMLDGKIDINPAKSIKLERIEKKNPEILTNKEIRQLLSMPNINEAKGARDKGMLELLYATGIRVSELINLDIQDIRCTSNERGEVICRSGRGTRTIPMHSYAAEAMNYYINNVRPKLLSADSGDALFINLNGSRLTRQGFWKIVKTYSEMAKIKKEITPHTLRHSFAMHLYQNGASLQDLQAMLGHADISSTQMYANISRQNSYADVYERCHPLASKAKQ